MGAQLVSAALDPHWATLSPVARIVLVKMALTAKDKATTQQPAGEYWGGYAPLIAALRGDIPDARTPERDAADQQIKRAIRELRNAKAVEPIDTATGRTRSRYRLTLTPSQPVDNLITLADRKANRGSSSDPHRGTPSDPLLPRIGGHPVTE